MKMKSPKCPHCEKSGGVILIARRVWDNLWGCLNCMRMFLVDHDPPEHPKIFHKEE